VASSPDAIGAVLRAAGFTIGMIEGDPSLVFVGLRVAGHQAYAGEQYQRGTVVDILFSTA
jgi:hypothetical protein